MKANALWQEMFSIDHKSILALALPMTLSNLSVPLLGLVDTAVIGHLDGAEYLGGVAVGSTIITFLFLLAGFLRMSTTGLVAQALGAGDSSRLVQLLINSVVIGGLLALLLLVFQWPLGELGFSLIGGSDAVREQAALYFYARIWSAPAALLNMVLLGWLLGVHNARAAMWLLIITNVINMLLDILLVVVFGWGVVGAALASVVADYCGLLWGGFLVWQIFLRKGLVAIPARQWIVWSQLKSLLVLNRDILIRTVCLQLSFAFVTFQGARFGDTVLAANAVLLNFLMLISMGLDGFAYACESQVGRAVGANNRQNFRKAVLGNLLWSVALAIVMSVLFALLGMQIIGLLTDLKPVREQAEIYLPYVIALPVLACGCYLLDGVFLGASRGREMRNAMLLSTLGVFFPLWWLCQGLYNHGLWLALCGFMVARAVTMGWIYLRQWPNWLAADS